MNITQKGIVTLIKSAVTEQAFSLPEGFDLEAASVLIRRHHMVMLAYDGAVCCGVSRDEPLMKQMFRAYCKGYVASEAQMREVRRVFAAFDENGIDYMPLKGSRMKALYPKPELRTMGDADVLIRMEQYDRITALVEAMGFQRGIETDYELVWENESLHLELHKGLVPTSSRDFYAYFGDGWSLAKEKEGTRYAMTAEDEWIYLFTHFTKHYRDGGIGCRHVADLWVYLRAHPELDEEYVKAELEKLGLLEFHGNIRRLLAVWFENAGTDDKIEYMTEFIFASGSWGQMEAHVLSRGLRDMKNSRGASGGRLSYIRRTLFPSAEVLREKYTVLKKAPVLLPAVWVVRPFYKLMFERDSLKKNKETVELLTQENLENHRRMMNYVGLE